MPLKITSICKRYNKSPAHFLCLKVARGNTDIEVVQGQYGYVKIPDELVPDFLAWVDEEVRAILMQHGVKIALQHVMTAKDEKEVTAV